MLDFFRSYLGRLVCDRLALGCLDSILPVDIRICFILRRIEFFAAYGYIVGRIGVAL